MLSIALLSESGFFFPIIWKIVTKLIKESEAKVQDLPPKCGVMVQVPDSCGPIQVQLLSKCTFHHFPKVSEYPNHKW